MKTKTEILKTKKEWKNYAEELETLLLLRPTLPDDKRVDDQWIKEYHEWWGNVVENWFVPDEDEQDDYGYADQKNFD